MTKNITLKAGKDSLSVPYQLWREALELAKFGGWEAAGTTAPDKYPFREPWDGAYEWPCGQTIALADGRHLGMSINGVLAHFSAAIAGAPRKQLATVGKFCSKGEFSIN